MFEYFIHRQKFAIALGQFISHSVVKGRTVEELNALDRVQLASWFYSEVPSDYLEGSLSREDVIPDIARYIDQRIPQTFFKRNGWKDGAPKTHKVDAESLGLVYHYDHREAQ